MQYNQRKNKIISFLNGANPSRRKVLSVGLAAGLSMPFLNRRAAGAGGGEVVVANWGGDWNERTVKYIEGPLVESAGIQVVRDLASSPNRRTKLLAQSRLPSGSIDVSHHNELDAYFLYSQDIWEQVDESDVPNLANVHPNLRVPYFVPWQYSGWVIIYNPSKVPEPPTSYRDLWDPKYKGKVGINETSYPWHIQAAALAAGGDALDWPVAQESLLELKAKVEPRIYPSHETLGVALANEEVWLACNFRSRAVQYKHDGIPVENVYPKEGSIATIYGASLTRNAPNRDNGLFYLNALLDPKGLSGLVAESFYAPSINNAELPPELVQVLEFTADEQQRMHFPNLERVAALTGEWLDWWNRDFKG